MLCLAEALRRIAAIAPTIMLNARHRKSAIYSAVPTNLRWPITLATFTFAGYGAPPTTLAVDSRPLW
jgi:hypothetical protein